MPLRAPHLRLVLAGLTLLFAFTAVFVTAVRDPRPHDLHVGIVGPLAALHEARAVLDPQRFSADRYPSEAAARRALLEDRLRGVLVAAPGRARILTASAYGSVPGLMTQQALTAVAAASGRPAATTDIRPLPAHDSRGLSAFFTVTGTIMAAVLFAVLLTVAGARLPVRARVAACALVAVLGGVVVALSVDTVVGALTGRFWGVAGIAALLIAAVVLSVHGLGRLFGPAGMASAALTFMLVGVSSAGGGMTYQLEPAFYRAISQLLPNGAALTALRNEVYFSGAHTLGALAALGAWAAGGALALALGTVRRGRLAR
jgi:hypothetical protein